MRLCDVYHPQSRGTFSNDCRDALASSMAFVMVEIASCAEAKAPTSPLYWTALGDVEHGKRGLVGVLAKGQREARADFAQITGRNSNKQQVFGTISACGKNWALWIKPQTSGKPVADIIGYDKQC